MTVQPIPGPVTVDPLAQHAASWLLRWARGQLDDDGAAPTRVGPPPAGVRHARPVMVVLTVYEGRASAGFSGQGSSLLDATMRAVAEAVAVRQRARRLQLDIVTDGPTPLPAPELDSQVAGAAARQAWARLTSWQDGLVVGSRGGATRMLVPFQLLLRGMARHGRDRQAATPRDILAAAGLAERPDAPGASPITAWRFTTDAWVESADRSRALPLVQGVIPIEQVSRDALLASARAGAEYLVRTMRADGSFTYTLDPWLGTRSRSAYNVVRHAGTAAALFEVAGATGEQWPLEAALRAMEHLARWYRPGAAEGLTCVLDHDGKAKLGASGLALLALSRKLELAPSADDCELARRLGRQIVALQRPDGAFDSYLRLRGDEPVGSVSLYYPGEAMLALARVAALGIDEGFLAAAHRGADYLIRSRDGRRRLPPDAWLIQALDLLHTTDPRPAYVEHALAIAASMLADQYGPDAPPAYVGGFGAEPIRSTRTTARVEGLVAACRLGRRVGDPLVPGILAAILGTVPHLLPMQYDLDNAFFLDDPEVVRGGMRGGLDDAEIRIDYAQHHISAMLGVRSLIEPSAVSHQPPARHAQHRALITDS